MGDWRNSQRVGGGGPGRPLPPRPNQPPPLLKEELEDIACEGCGAVYILEVGGMKHVRHRIARNVGQSRQVWWLCLGCRKQVDNSGKLVAEDSPDRIPAEILKEVNRG